MSVRLQSAVGGASRRDFLKRSAAVAAAAQLALGRTVHAAGSDELKIALIGCGGRGTGAAAQALNTAGPVKLWAMADAFADRLELSLASLTGGGKVSQGSAEGLAAKVDVPPERRFVGLDAYQQAIDSGVDVVVDASPPGVRPAHFEYAVRQGKHVFTEKPLASDAPGVRKVLAAAKEARRKNLKVGVGLQRHHQQSYLETIRRIHDGEIGKLMILRCYWNTGYPGKSQPERLPGQTEMEYQLRNWYFFTWLSGDHICEQHIHNLDVSNWVMDGHPVEANGMGGRQVRTGPDWGQIFDHHFVEFTYADGTKMFSQCRQIQDCWRSVTEHAHGTEGHCDVSGSSIAKGGETVWSLRAPRGKKQGLGNPYQIEHDVLFDAIRNDKPHMEAEYGATSTMTAILGRMATYSGKVVTWDEAFSSELSLLPERLAFDAPAPVAPGADGLYPVAVPGVTKAW